MTLQRFLKGLGYPAFAGLVFLLTLYASLPKERIRERLEAAASATMGVPVKAEGFGLTLLSGPGVSADQVTVATSGSGPQPTIYRVSDLTVHFSLIQLLRHFADTSFSARVAGGSISGRYRAVGEELTMALRSEEISLAEIPAFVQLLGVPVAGRLELKLDATTPKSMTQLGGALQLKIADAVLGDGKNKIAIPNYFTAEKLTRLAFGTLHGSVQLDKGRATLHDIRTHSPDIDFDLEGYIELRDPLQYSILHLYLKIKPSEALVKREPMIDTLMLAGAAMRRPDGYFGILLSGPLASAAPTFMKEPPPDVRASVSSASAALPPYRSLPRGEPGAGPSLPSEDPPSHPAPEPPDPSGPSGPPPQGGAPPNLVAPATAIPPRAMRFAPSESPSAPAPAGVEERLEPGTDREPEPSPPNEAP